MAKSLPMFAFHPILKPVLWGGNRIALLKGETPRVQHVGESWEISGVEGHESVVAYGPDAGRTLPELISRYGADLVGSRTYDRFGTRFPILVKFIDANRDLSLQVHPDDDLARLRHNATGKTEMWYVVDATDNAVICSGLKRNVTPNALRRAVDNGTVMDLVANHRSHPGDAFYLPAGRIHTIGAGNLLVEFQQTSDITYRLYDYDRRDANGNTRPLHVDLALDAIDYRVADNYRLNVPPADAGCHRLLQCPYFVVDRVVVNGDLTIDLPRDHSFTIAVCIAGSTTLSIDNGMSPTTLQQGHTLLLPAAAPQLHCRGNATILLAQLP